MGCATSKQKRLCRNCQAPCSPGRRSFSVQGVLHHPRRRLQEDSYHLVALTSSTLGSLKLNEEKTVRERVEDNKRSRDDFAMELIQAKNWSQMMDEKIPKVVPRTPIRTPPGEPEMINIWELMEGLEEISPLKPFNPLRSFSFHGAPDPVPSFHENQVGSPKPLWLQMAEVDGNSNSNATSVISEFDPAVISEFRKSMEELPETNPFQLKPLMNSGERPKEENLTDEEKGNGDEGSSTCDKEKVIVYFTSLRGVRRTHEDSCDVRVILKGLGVRVDERDVSMHSGFKEELKELLGELGLSVGGGGLPRVFVGRRYIGGAEEIRRMHEEGQLEKLMEGCEMVDDGGIHGVCDSCGDVRFVPCEKCSGSCKIYYDSDDERECGFQRCAHCNENGLVRCPICCDH